MKPSRDERPDVQANKQRFHETAIALRISGGLFNDMWFAGFGDSPKLEATSYVKLRYGLCDARLIGGSNPNKAQDYVRRLAARGFVATIVAIGATGAAS